MMMVLHSFTIFAKNTNYIKNGNKSIQKTNDRSISCKPATPEATAEKWNLPLSG
jgi:hypothetical protein